MEHLPGIPADWVEDVAVLLLPRGRLVETPGHGDEDTILGIHDADTVNSKGAANGHTGNASEGVVSVIENLVDSDFDFRDIVLFHILSFL